MLVPAILTSLLLFCSPAYGLPTARWGAEAPLLHLPQGTYKGSLSPDGTVEAFRGIPYVQMPRFKGPIPYGASRHDPRSDESDAPIDATKNGGACPQGDKSPFDAVLGHAPPDMGPFQEECGYLSVYRPVGLGKRKRHNNGDVPPIMFFIHGGAYAGGTSQMGFYDGMRLARDGDVVVVAINYRLALLGFLYHDDWLANPDPLPWGIQDAIAALEWTHSHADQLGGDVSRLTTFGQSAGGNMQQVLISHRPDLIRRSILQSAAPQPYSLDMSKGVREIVDKLAAQNLTNATLETATWEQLLQIQVMTIGEARGKYVDAGLGDPFWVQLPCELDSMFPGFEDGTCPKGKRWNNGDDGYKPQRDITVVWNKDDGSFFKYLYIHNRGLNYTGAEADAYAAEQSLGSLITEDDWATVSLDYGHLMQAQGAAVTFGKMVWSPPGWEYGACHCMELPLLLGTQEAWKDSPMLSNSTWEEVDALGLPVRKAWAQFARDGTPPGAINPVLDNNYS